MHGLFALLASAAAAVLLGLAVAALLRRRRILATPTAAIGSAAGGLVELHGHVRPLATLTAPYSGAPCVYYRFRLAERRGTGKRRRTVVLRHGEAREPFLVDDGSGLALVRPDGATLVLDRARHASSVTLRDATPELASFCARVGVDPTGLFGFNRALTLEESFLGVDDEVFVLGHARLLGPVEARQSGARLAVSGGKGDLLVGDGDEARVTSALLRRGLGLLAGAVALGVVSAAVWASRG